MKKKQSLFIPFFFDNFFFSFVTRYSSLHSIHMFVLKCISRLPCWSASRSYYVLKIMLETYALNVKRVVYIASRKNNAIWKEYRLFVFIFTSPRLSCCFCFLWGHQCGCCYRLGARRQCRWCWCCWKTSTFKIWCRKTTCMYLKYQFIVGILKAVTDMEIQKESRLRYL